MNDEIKKILRDLEFASGVFDYTITPDRCTFLKDYITNLQQENEKLEKHKEYYKNETKRLGKLFYITKEENIKLEEAQKNFEKQFIKEMNYKSRIEKTVEYIQNHQLVFELSSKKVISQWFDMFYKDTLNILNGRSDE